ncbi:MAG TPA: ABC transporter ATP-binding protein [Steroidobacteraceae bacterium]|nr:ABC transporter ATP-binding protein [Steroidobacteraceae bacterium]
MIVQTHDLSKRFGRHDALDRLNLSIPEGSAFALIGANGAGKTTTIKVLMNLLRPTSGAATVLGVESTKLSPKEFAQIGYVSENQDMPKPLTVAQYLNYLRPFYPTWDRALEAEILKQLRLPLDRKIGALSHGMRMKMSLACALPFRPKLLVLDEPFSGLDPLVRDEFMDGLIAQAGEMTVLISSHELAEIEGVVTHVGFMDQGRLLFQESMEALSNRLREVRVTLEGEASAKPYPKEWLQVRTMCNVLSFVDTQFSAESMSSRILSIFGSVRHIEVQPIALRSIFTTLAREARDAGVAI